MAGALSIDEGALAHAIPVWSIVRVVPGAERDSRPVSFHLTRASALEDQERRGGPPGNETEGFAVQRGTLLAAFEFGTFSVEEVRREIARETGPLDPAEQLLAARTPLWIVWYEDRFGYGEDRDPAIAEAFFFTREEAEKYANDRGGEPTIERFTGYTVSRGTVLDARTNRTIPLNSAARELLARFPAELEERMLERVREFVVAETGIAKTAIERGTLVVDDLGVRGREGARLMAAFFEAFGVNPSGFEVTRYFAPETMGLLGSISALMAGGPPRRTLAIDDLVAAAMVGRWL